MPTKHGAQFLEVKPNDGIVETPNRHLSSDEFHAKYYESELGKEILKKIESPVEPQDREHNVKLMHSNDGLKKMFTNRYRNNCFVSLRLLMGRELLLWWRDRAAIKARLSQDLMMGIISGTVFWQSADDVSSVLGILFQSAMFIAIGAMTKVPPQYAVRGVLYKHQDANFFPTWTFVVGRSIASMPTSIIDGLVYGTIIYWFVGLAHNDGASFGNYVMFVLITTFFSTGIGLLLSIFSAVTKDRGTGQACTAVSFVLFILFSGFTVSITVTASDDFIGFTKF